MADSEHRLKLEQLMSVTGIADQAFLLDVLERNYGSFEDRLTELLVETGYQHGADEEEGSQCEADGSGDQEHDADGSEYEEEEEEEEEEDSNEYDAPSGEAEGDCQESKEQVFLAYIHFKTLYIS